MDFSDGFFFLSSFFMMSTYLISEMETAQPLSLHLLIISHDYWCEGKQNSLDGGIFGLPHV